MFEEVCLLCGRPTSADGRAYCSDECESQDTTSPSISTTSSAYPSPHLQSSMNAPGNLAEVPALVSSALGHSLTSLEGYKTHNRNRRSISSSSTSSLGWSALDDEEDDSVNLAFNLGSEDEFNCNPEMSGADVCSLKSAGSYGHLLHPHSALSYARRPSTTNNRSTIPMLHRRTSSNSIPASAAKGVSRSVPYYSTEDDSDVPSTSISSFSSARSNGRRDRHLQMTSDTASQEESEREKDSESISRSKRNRTSLPAYFSLLSMTNPSSVHSRRSPSSLQTLSAISKSLQSSPPTPRLANPLADTATAFLQTQAQAQAQARASPQDVEPSCRGRSQRRDPGGRSSSSRQSPSPSRRQPSRASAVSPCLHHIGPHTRARLDSMEKVIDWVAHSPVLEKMLDADSGVEFGALEQQAVVDLDDDEGYDVRGRRRVDELDDSPDGLGRDAPGFGNGRTRLARALDSGASIYYFACCAPPTPAGQPVREHIADSGVARIQPAASSIVFAAFVGIRALSMYLFPLLYSLCFPTRTLTRYPFKIRRVRAAIGIVVRSPIVQKEYSYHTSKTRLTHIYHYRSASPSSCSHLSRSKWFCLVAVQ
ncbi:hypothetical protein A0H81_04093 [Grifola frondosa]|uniref:Uncharacterized protein n=1 Tax=Grifola frondosa TaxID=5627 RepID=A0A1C7MF88_GRIFR|nr:hypothetical protein A0H81_04093 [Grifola frondosa]